jgi:uncharacterized protein YbbK (DUF523 family)
MTERIRRGVKTCLFGENVRFDGGHKHDRFLTGNDVKATHYFCRYDLSW